MTSAFTTERRNVAAVV